MARPSKPADEQRCSVCGMIHEDEHIERTPQDHAKFSEDMRRIRYSQIANALAVLDSHTVYGRDGLAKLEAAGIDIDRLSSQSRRQVERAIEARGLGGWVDPNGPDKLYTGHVVSDEVLVMLGFAPAGRRFYGRGSAHRANIEQLRQAAKA